MRFNHEPEGLSTAERKEFRVSRERVNDAVRAYCENSGKLRGPYKDQCEAEVMETSHYLWQHMITVVAEEWDTARVEDDTFESDVRNYAPAEDFRIADIIRQEAAKLKATQAA